MRKFLALFVFFVSCNKTVEPIASIEKLEYIDLSYEKQPCVIFYIKVNDTLLSDKLKNKELREFRVNTIPKKDRNYFFYEVWKEPVKKGNIFSFLIRTSYFSQNISDREKRKKRFWSEDRIVKVLSGDVSLIFDKDSICLKASKDRKIIVQMSKE